MADKKDGKTPKNGKDPKSTPKKTEAKSKASTTKATTSKKPTSSKQDNFVTKEIYNECVKNVSVLFLYEDTVKLIKSDETLRGIITDSLDIIHTYETLNKSKDSKAEDFEIAFKTITSKSYTSKVIDKNQYEEFEDKLSFLPIYIKNNLKSEWGSIIDSFKGNLNLAAVLTNNAQNQSTDKVETVETEKVESTNNTNTNQSFNFNNKEFVEKNINMDQMADQILNQQANMMLLSDIRENKFYQFDSKPSAYIWAKWVYYISIICFGLALISWLCIFLFTKQGFFFFGENIPLAPVLKDEFYKSFAPNITSFGVGGYTYWISIIVGGAMLFSGLKKMSTLFMKNANDNMKYSHRSMYTFWIILVLIFTILSPFWASMFSGSGVGNGANYFNWLSIADKYADVSGEIIVNDGSANGVKFVIDNASYIGAMKAISSLSYVLIGLVVLVIVTNVIMKSIAPKPDVARIQAQINQYKSDIKSGKVQAPSAGMPGAGGMFGGRSPFSSF
ncbi:MAG: hypothetical protein ACRC4M_03080 [Mycoplasma sp.]